ncbi:MAG: agmatinase [Thermodesulfobacteriota bacterium]
MISHPIPFLDPGPEFSDPVHAAVILLPVPYEGGVSWGRGAALGPDAVLEASAEVEIYDESLRFEPCRMGIATIAPPDDLSRSEAMISSVRRNMRSILETGKFPVALGGDHSVSVGVFQELYAKYGRLSVVQIDAHADLRENYRGDPFSHACTMARIRENTGDTLQIGIRSLCREEADRITREDIPVCFMEEFRSGAFDLEGAVRRLPDPVFITVDVDALDWSVVRSTGTPEPGGFLWHEVIDLLAMLFREREVAGFDVMELSQDPPDRNSAFAVAKLVYKMLGYKLASTVAAGRTLWPERPAGPILTQTGPWGTKGHS